MSQSPTDKALALLAASNLHRSFYLSRTEGHERLRVTFSTTSNFSNEILPVILFCGPMFGSRYTILHFEAMAKKEGVRVIVPDRPGIGGSTPIPLPQRRTLWLEMVPALLSQLNIQHVSLLSHSAGTTYALATLYHLPHLLHPEKPYVALLGPWVSQTQSDQMLLQTAAALPEGILNGWSSLVSFVNTKVVPVGAWSGGLSGGLTGLLTGGKKEVQGGEEKFGVDGETAKEVEKFWTKFTFAEQGMAGATDEMKLCLGRGGKEALGICADYEEYVRRLVERRKIEPARLTIDVFFAEDDSIIGVKGKEYFEKCWQRDGIAEAVDVKFEVCEGTDHESVLVDIEKGGVERAFGRVAELGSM